MKHLPVLLMLFLPAFQAVSQELPRTDTDQWKQNSLLPIMPSVKYSISF